MDKNKKVSSPPAAKPVSLKPLSVEDAVEGLLGTPPPGVRPASPKKRSAKRKPAKPKG